MAQEAEGIGQSLGSGEVAPEPQREAEQLVAQEPSEVVTELVEVQPGEAAQTNPGPGAWQLDCGEGPVLHASDGSWLYFYNQWSAIIVWVK